MNTPNKKHSSQDAPAEKKVNKKDPDETTTETVKEDQDKKQAAKTPQNTNKKGEDEQARGNHSTQNLEWM